MSDPQSSETQQTTAVGVESEPVVNEGAPIGFFAIGLVLNLVLIGAYFIWAARNWKKTDVNDES